MIKLRDAYKARDAWSESSISIASVRIWQFYDMGDVGGILVDDIGNNMDKQGMPIKK